MLSQEQLRRNREHAHLAACCKVVIQVIAATLLVCMSLRSCFLQQRARHCEVVSIRT